MTPAVFLAFASILAAGPVVNALLNSWIIPGIIAITAIVILYRVALHYGYVIPKIFEFMFWACLIAAAAILAIRFLMTL